MNRFLQIVLILLLLLVAILQVMAARGIFSNRVKQEVCPVGAITMVNGKAVIDTIKCIGCGRCVDGFLALPQLELPVIIPLQTDSTDSSEIEAIPPDKSSEEKEDLFSPKSFNKEKEEVDTALYAQKLISDSVAVDSTALDKDSKQRRQYYVVDREQCIACNLCLRVCPEKAITYIDGKACIDSLKCSNCGICAGLEPSIFRGCPVGAIHPNNP